MSTGRAALVDEFRHLVRDDIPAAPDSGIVLVPGTTDEVASILAMASRHHIGVLVWGAGTNQGYGYRMTPDVTLVTTGLNRLVDWSPDDLTAVAQAGLPVAELERKLDERNQTAALPERPGSATLGGAVAAGVSGWRRLRYGPTRDRLLEVTLVTGDGRTVRGGGRVVKNVTGYDLPRLAVGSLGALGVVVEMAVKLWPRGRARATVRVGDAGEAVRQAYRPLAVIEDNDGTRVFLEGTRAEVEAQAGELDGEASEGLDWPEPLGGLLELAVRVPPALTRAAVERVPTGWRYQAGFGTGEVRASGDSADVAELTRLREWAAEFGGAVVTVRAPADFYTEFDPWGRAPQSAGLQRRVKEAFDPAGIVNAGRLPGGI